MGAKRKLKERLRDLTEARDALAREIEMETARLKETT